MPNSIVYTPVFVKRAKHFKKKHLSLPDDLALLETSLIANPRQGADLGGGLYKIRLAVKSKGKGKSGGYRIISYVVTTLHDESVITLVYINDKSEESTISKNEILELLNPEY